MVNIEQVKEEYREEVTKLLSRFPNVLQAFEREWQSGKFRQAFLVIHKAARQFDIKLSPELEQVSERFYWLFVN